MAKWDSIEKHARKRKNFDGKWYMDIKCAHLLCLQLYNSSKITSCPLFLYVGS